MPFDNSGKKTGYESPRPEYVHLKEHSDKGIIEIVYFSTAPEACIGNQ